MDNDVQVAVIDDEYLIKVFTNKRYVYYVGHELRLGFNCLSALVEYTYFHPTKGPRDNDEFHYYLINFGILHKMFGVPVEFEEKVNNIALRIKLNTVLGVPYLADPSGGIKEFPGAEAAKAGRCNLYGIERGDKLIYSNDQAFAEEIRKRESKIVDLLLQYGSTITPEIVCEFLWGN